MECQMCGGLVEWRSVACDQTQCRRCGATDSQVEEEEQDDNAAPTAETLMGEAISAGLGRSAEDWETMPAVEPDAGNDGGPTEADLRGLVDHVADHNKWVDELASEIEWEPLRNFVLRLKKPESDLRGDVDHGD